MECLLTPKYGYAEVEIFLVSVVYARLYDSAASSASPLGSAASLAISYRGGGGGGGTKH